MLDLITCNTQWRPIDIGNPEADPPMISVGSSTWRYSAGSGRFAKPVKLGPRTTVWRVEDIRAWIEQADSNG